jgi:cell division protein FtsI (penicillin-binding protein 3)
VIALLAAGVKLVGLQTVMAGQLSAESAKQRTTRVAVLAGRGDILDRSGNPLAFSVDTRAITANPRLIKANRGAQASRYTAGIAADLAQHTGKDPAALLAELDSDKGYVVLATDVDPEIARAFAQRYPEIKLESRESRRYPGGTLASNVVGAAGWDTERGTLRGLVGLESARDASLGGVNGFRVVDTAEGSDTVIPGSTRAEQVATPGSTLRLTLDADLQYTVQRLLVQHVERTGARGGSAVVLDAGTGEVRALANSQTFDPNDLGAASAPQLGNPAVTSPYEPGSVNKVVTMAAALEYGVARPDTVFTVPDHFKIADRTVSDAWPHPPQQFTLTGVLAMSSNVGTLMTAHQVGQDRFADMLHRFGIGERTGIELPGESPGRVPPRSEWSGTTFGNLPIGQGLSMTVLQMAGMYQAVANNGVRVPPRIVTSTVSPDGTERPEPRPEPVRVITEQTAAELRGMLHAVTQDASGQRGTGPLARVSGYEVAGKTGTAQQVDPGCGCYLGHTFWITFAGMLPADNPRYVIALMLDAPPGGDSAAPLFRDIAGSIAQRERIPVSTGPPPPIQILQP